jgi:hypothetical protein
VAHPFLREVKRLWWYCMAVEGAALTENLTSMSRILTSPRSLLRVKMLFIEVAFLQAISLGCRILSTRRFLSEEERCVEYAMHP